MSTAPTSLSDTLPSNIPKLDASGINWAIFAVHFQDAVEAKGFWGHFDGTKTRPVAVAPAAKPIAVPIEGEDAPAHVVDEPALTAEALALAQKQWDKDELSAKSLLTQKIPDSTLMRVHTKKTVRECWEAIVTKYTEKGTYEDLSLPPHGFSTDSMVNPQYFFLAVGTLKFGIQSMESPWTFNEFI